MLGKMQRQITQAEKYIDRVREEIKNKLFETTQ